jgi:amino acid adenylation domain-containing protein/non-ribosomal peptide synthase protein (TIGR01720 family)
VTTASVGLKNVEDIYPLSPLQQGLLFHSLASPRSGVYLQQFRCAISGDLQVEVFRQAWRGLLDRHPVLRTAFLWTDLDRPLQVVRRKVELPWNEEDWRGLSEAESERRFDLLLELDRERGFDLGKAPLMRFCLRQTGADRWYFAWSFHHILFDGWSLPLLLREVIQGYEATLRGVEIPWPERRPYREYIAWLQAQDLEKAEAFWRRTLRGFKAPTPLLSVKTHRRPGESGDGYHRLELGLAVEETNRLQDWARRNQLSLNTLVQGAFAVLLARYSRSRDVVFGATSSGRTPALKGVEEMVGLFVNTLPIRVPYDDDLELLSWLRALQADHARIREFEYSPLMSIQKWSELAPGTPLFETILVFENYPVDHSSPTAGRAVSVAISSPRLWERTNYPLTVVAAVRGGSLTLRAMFERARLDDSAVTRALTHLLQLFRGMAAGSRRLDELRLLAASERHQLVYEWNDTEREPPGESTVTDLFRIGSADAPEAVALQDGERHLSYRALESESRKLARCLHEIGVAAEVRVGIWADRSLEMIVGILGVLEAGAAYVPLDVSHPAERLSFVLEDAGVSVLLETGDPDLDARHPQIPVLSMERLDDPRRASAARTPAARSENLAYVLYTSGSTGRPKGVAMPQRPLVNLLSWHLRCHPLEEGARVLQFAALGFDVSFQEIFSTLSAGGCLVLMPDGGRRDALELLRFLSEARIERVFLPFVALQQLSEVASRGTFPHRSLREIITAGEQLHLTAAVREFLSRGRPCTLYNHYGPTECHVVTSHRVAPDAQSSLPPIGRPISRNRILVLDSAGEPAPLGVPGELHIGGASLARGYLGRPQWTAERFVPSPANGVPGARLYRTGDLARWLEDGELDFLGRSDRQVKIRGFRVEPGEVEGALEDLPSVGQAVVDLRYDRHGLPRLVAYVLLASSNESSDGPPTSADLRRALNAQLPGYMIPSTFVVLDSLPLTPSGKVDRRALPDPEAIRPELPNAFVAPRTETEKVLSILWSEILGIDRVGIHDNFFELGGDSIVCIQMVAKAQQRQLLLTPTQVFENQTIAELALVVGWSRNTLTDEGPVTGPLPLTPIQLWFFEQEFLESHHWNMALLLEVQQKLDPRLLREAIDRMLVQHDALRMRFHRDRRAWSARIATVDETRGQQVFAYVDLAALSPAEQSSVQERASVEFQRSLDLGRGPLLRAALYGRESSHDRLFLVVHHLVMDGVSWRVLLTDLLAIYEQLSRGREVVLLPRTTSVKDWATKLTEWARFEAASEEIDFWTSIARGPKTRLPVDLGGPNQASSSDTVSRFLSAEDTRALLTDVPGVYRTQINDVLLTAVARTLTAWMGGTDVLIHLEGHGREELFENVDLSRTVGWFTALYPVRLSLEGAEDVGSALRSVKEQIRRIPNRGIGYGVLRYLRDDPELADVLKAGSAEISFNYLGQFDRVLPATSPFGLAPESRGGSTSPDGHRAHLIDVTAMVLGGSLQILWVYSTNVHRRETIEELATTFAESLRAIVIHCRDEAVGGCTPSDFPLVSLPQATLDELVGTGRHIEDIYPLSPLQSGLLFETLYQRNSWAYFEQLSCTFVGDFEVAAFKRSWERMMERHAVLRSRFAWEGLEQPVQIVHRNVVMPWKEEDWRSLSAEEQERRSAVFLKEDRARGFSMREAPVMRAALFRVADDRWKFVWSHHHILLDGWSLQILLKDLILSYESFVHGREIELESPRRYRDYIAWLGRRDRSEEASFWRETLRGFTAPTPLVMAGAGEAPREENYDQKVLRLSADETKALEEFASGQKLTLNTLVEGAWALLLSLYSGEEDVLFGTTVSGRSADIPGIQSMIGMFVNTLPVRVRVPSDRDLVPWLQELQSQQAQMRQYEHSALVDVHGASDVPRERPLFESLLVVENYPLDRSLRDHPGASVLIRDVEFPQRTSYPLTIVAVPRTRLTLYMMYDGARFREPVIVRLLDQMGNLLSGMARDPSRRVLDIPADVIDTAVTEDKGANLRARSVAEEFDFGDVS